MAFSWINRRKKVVCFIDDDKHELNRFRTTLRRNAKIHCITGETISACRAELINLNLKPDVWILDLYFSDRENSAADREEMVKRYAKLEKHVDEFRGWLRTIGQGPEGGLKLIGDCKADRVPVIMFTRKGNLEDGLRCIDDGAVAVLKKPMPSSLNENPEQMEAQLDQAMVDKADYLAEKILRAIHENTFWIRHRGKLSAVGTGAGGLTIQWLGKLLGFL